MYQIPAGATGVGDPNLPNPNTFQKIARSYQQNGMGDTFINEALDLGARSKMSVNDFYDEVRHYAPDVTFDQFKGNLEGAGYQLGQGPGDGILMKIDQGITDLDTGPTSQQRGEKLFDGISQARQRAQQDLAFGGGTDSLGQPQIVGDLDTPPQQGPAGDPLSESALQQTNQISSPLPPTTNITRENLSSVIGNFLQSGGGYDNEEAMAVYNFAKEAGLSAEDIAEASGGSVDTVRAWEQSSGVKPLPSRADQSKGGAFTLPDDPNEAIRTLMARNATGQGNGMEDAMSIYKLAIDNAMSAEDLEKISGVDKADIQAWLDDHRLSLQGTQSASGSATADLDNSPVPQAEAAQATAGQATASGATAGQATAVTGEVTPDQTAIHQLMQMMQNPIANKFLKLQEDIAIERAGRRGMINSSIAGADARAAAIEAGAPLAINDANTYRAQAIANQDAGNEANQLNARLDTDVSQSNAALETQVSQSNADSQTRVSQSNAAAQTDVNRSNAQLAQSDRESQRSATTSRENALLSAETQRLINLADNETRTNLQQMSDATSMAIEQFRAQANIDANSDSNRTQAFSNLINAIGAIEGNPEMNAVQKSEAIRRTVNYYNSFLGYIDSIGLEGGTTQAPGGGDGTLDTAPSGNDATTWGGFIEGHPDLRAAFEAQDWTNDATEWGEWWAAHSQQDPRTRDIGNLR